MNWELARSDLVETQTLETEKRTISIFLKCEASKYLQLCHNETREAKSISLT